MSRFLRTRDGSSIDMLGVAALAFILIAIVIGAAFIAPVVSLYRHPPSVSLSQRDAADSLKRFHEATDHETQLVNGRSWFFEPHAPNAVPVDTVKPKYYGGPSIIAFINGTAYFSDGQKISAAQPKSKSLEFVRADPPWSITVKWEGGEFPVKIFERTDILSLKDGSGFSSSIPAAPPKTLLTGANGERTDLPPDARRGPGADGSGASPAVGEVLTRPAPTPDPGSAPSGTPPPAAPPAAPGATPPAPAPTPAPSTPPAPPADPRPEAAPQTETTHTSKP